MSDIAHQSGRLSSIANVLRNSSAAPGAGVWCVARIGVALRRGTPYVMAAWDGGILRVGVRLGSGRTTIKIKLVATASIATFAVLLLTGGDPQGSVVADIWSSD